MIDLGASLRPRTRPASLERMSGRSRLLTKDEELGKRDDDFKPRLREPSMSAILPWRWRKRRLFIALSLIFLIYWLAYHIPASVESAINSRITTPNDDPYTAVAFSQPSGAPPRDKDAPIDGDPQHYYNGIIRYYKLAKSLHRISRTMGTMVQNRNVLFAASSLKSAANLVPMACEMAKVDRSHAHFALFGRSSLSLDEVLAINGVNENDCKAFFHDARGDFAEYSSDARDESATKGAMKHINEFMHPQAIITDDSSKENSPFLKGIRTKAKDIGKPLIEIPSGQYENFLWITRLDAGSLGNWFKPDIEIVIHAPPGSSGGLIRLLKSLADADYRGLKVPRLTIELPSDVEHFLQKYLADFKWPPRRGPLQANSLTLRHRIANSRISSEQAAVRFVESFYPSNQKDHHVLVLSPQAEVSPLYLQYLYFHILEYHYTTFGWETDENLLGLSLDVPTASVNGKDIFRPPTTANMTWNKFAKDKNANPHEPSPFLYQAASATAMLVFGEKWAVFHDFLSKRIQASRSGKTGRTSKVVSETEPAWVEFLLELMRARGWSVLHPASGFVTIHNELAQIPEEFVRSSADDKKDVLNEPEDPEEEPFVLSAEPPILVEHIEADPTRSLMPLHLMLPFDGELQDLSQLPYISHEGVAVTSWHLDEKKDEYVPWFRAAIGGCRGDQATRARLIQDRTTADLFCIPGVDMRFVDESEPEDDWAEHVAQAIVDSTDDALDASSTVQMPAADTQKAPTGDTTGPEPQVPEKDESPG